MRLRFHDMVSPARSLHAPRNDTFEPCPTLLVPAVPKILQRRLLLLVARPRLLLTCCRLPGGARHPPPSEDAAQRAKNAAGGLYKKAKAAADPREVRAAPAADRGVRRHAAAGRTPISSSWCCSSTTGRLGSRRRSRRAQVPRPPSEGPEGRRGVTCRSPTRLYSAKDQATRAAALEDWCKHLVARDVAGDVPKASVLLDFVTCSGCARRSGRKRTSRSTPRSPRPTSSTPSGWSSTSARETSSRTSSGTGRARRPRSRRGSSCAEAGRDRRRAAGGIPPDQIEAEIKKLDAK